MPVSEPFTVISNSLLLNQLALKGSEVQFDLAKHPQGDVLIQSTFGL